MRRRHGLRLLPLLIRLHVLWLSGSSRLDRRWLLRLGARAARPALRLKMLLRYGLTRLVAIMLGSNRMLFFYLARIALPRVTF